MSAVFKTKKILPTKRVCLRLKEARLSCGISLSELEKKTKISKKHLLALEECRFDELPKAIVYQKNFLKSYVEALKLDFKPFLKQYLIEETDKNKKIEHPIKMSKQTKAHYLPMVFKLGGMSLLVILIMVYLGLQVRNILEPPSLVVFSPQDGYVTEEKSIIIEGQTEPEAKVFINGKEVGNNEKGNFKETVELITGVNTIILSVEKKHGKKTEVVKRVVLKE